MPMIEVDHLFKRYGGAAADAVHDVSFAVSPGQVLGLLGPNGAGKTTILRIVSGALTPGAGTVRIDGFATDGPSNDGGGGAAALKARIGYLPENAPVYGDLSPIESLEFVAAAHQIPRAARAGAITKAVDVCGLGPYRRRRLDTLSKGCRQRTALAQALVHDPPVLILDEPTTGLDPNQIIEVRSLIRDLGTFKTVILSSHFLKEVEAVCSRVLILNEGRVAAQGAPAEIANAMRGGEAWEVTLTGPAAGAAAALAGGPGQPGLAGAAAAGLAGLAGAAVTAVEELPGGALRVSLALEAVDGAAGVSGGERIFDWAVGAGVRIAEMTRQRASLEDVFARLTRG